MEEEYSHYTDGYTIELGDSTYNIKDSSIYGSVRIYRKDNDGSHFFLRADDVNQIFQTLSHLDKLCLKYHDQLKEYERAHETLKYSLERMDII